MLGADHQQPRDVARLGRQARGQAAEAVANDDHPLLDPHAARPVVLGACGRPDQGVQLEGAPVMGGHRQPPQRRWQTQRGRAAYTAVIGADGAQASEAR